MMPIPILQRVATRLGLRAADRSLAATRFSDYISACGRAGIDRRYLFLSFDCDTDLDADVVEELHEFLTNRNIAATYAVPGAQLQKAAGVYKRLAESGAEFMNHGALPHAEFKNGRWNGITFYDSMQTEAVIADIIQGHEIVTEITGVQPEGFRAPHFGCFQKPEQVSLMHQTAAELGYLYCSTTTPITGLVRGPAFRTEGIIEFPCFGSTRNPETILDSWTYLTDRTHYTLGDAYYDLLYETVVDMQEKRIPGILTWYCDPCHVMDQPPFLKAIELLANSDVVSLTGGQLARKLPI